MNSLTRCRSPDGGEGLTEAELTETPRVRLASPLTLGNTQGEAAEERAWGLCRSLAFTR